jgi:putative ABC transport system substrate-binding protein
MLAISHRAKQDRKYPGPRRFDADQWFLANSAAHCKIETLKVHMQPRNANSAANPHFARREFTTLLGGAAAALAFAARAQQQDRMRGIGVLMNRAADAPDGQARVAAFLQGLQQLGWSDGRNVRIDTRWGEDRVDLERKYGAELVALAPDVIFAAGTLGVTAVQRVTRTLPIVFAAVIDPVGAAVVDSLARPGGNATGFLVFEFSLGGKWLALLNQIAPSVTHVLVLRDPDVPSGVVMFGAIQNAAQSLGVEVRPAIMHDADEIERAVAAFVRSGNGGLIVTPGASASVYRDLIRTLAAKHRLPAVYPYRYLVDGGGLMSYAPDLVDDFRRAAGYVDRILKVLAAYRIDSDQSAGRP